MIESELINESIERIRESTQYIMEHELAASKSQARQLLLNALTYNVVREAVVDQIAFLIDADEK